LAADPAADARALLAAARHGALSTLGSDGAPFVSLVAVATIPANGEPLFLLSRLARHTQNLAVDPRAALLVAEPSQHPMAAGRLTVCGRMHTIDGEEMRARFLAIHPEARVYAGFADFGLWRLGVDGAHLVAGFGQIVNLPAEALRPSAAGTDGQT
jgi:putative heme iron utilization protein